MEMENIKFCEATPKQVLNAARLGVSVGFLTYVVLAVAGMVHILGHMPLYLSYRLYDRLARLVPALTLVGAVAFLADAQRERPSLVTCEPWGGVHWIAFLVNLCFLVRLLLHWGVTFEPQLVACVVDVWLFTQACFALHKSLNIYAFTFITLIRFLYSDCIIAWNRLSKVTRSVFGLVLAILVIAGALQVAEEYNTVYGSHPTSDDTLQPMRSFWVYVYWAVVTGSTVGYGEITPTTKAGKAIAALAVVAGVLWFVTMSDKLSNALKMWFREGCYPPPDSNQPRVVVLGESNPNNMAGLLKAARLNPKVFEVIVLVSEEVMSGYLWLPSILPVKVMSCTSLQEDLSYLMPPIDNKRYSKSRENDVVVIFGDHEAEDPEAEDMRVLQLLVQARESAPDRRFVVHVALSRSSAAVQQTPCWSEQDLVVCLEELCVDLLVQDVACSAAAPIICNLFGKSTDTGENIGDPAGGANAKMPKISIQEPSQFEYDYENQSFIEVVEELYMKHGHLLLGFFSPETQDFELLPDDLPPNVHLITIPPNKIMKVMAIETPEYMDEEGCGDVEEVNVAVRGAGPGREAMEAALKDFPAVNLLPEEEWRKASTVAVTTAGMSLSYVIEAHYIRTSVVQESNRASGNKNIRFVTDVFSGQGQKTSDYCTTSNVINKSIVVQAVATAIHDRHMYQVWRSLAAQRNLVGVRMTLDCTYGEAFHMLLERRLLPLGVEKVQDINWYTCNPTSLMPLEIGDLLLCLQMTSAPLSSASPPVVLSPGTNLSRSVTNNSQSSKSL